MDLNMPTLQYRNKVNRQRQVSDKATPLKYKGIQSEQPVDDVDTIAHDLRRGEESSDEGMEIESD